MIRHWFSDVHAFRHDPLGLISERGAGSVDQLVSLALGPRPVMLVRDPNLVKPLMKLSEERSDKGRLVHKIREVIGSSTLTMSGEAHRIRRVVLHERLSRGVANTYVGEMSATIRATCLQLSREPTFRADLVGGSLALKLVCIALFGHRVLTPGDELAVMDAVNALEADLQSEMFRFLPRTPWRKYRDLRNRQNALRTMEYIISKVSARAQSSSVLTALKDLGLTETELRDELTAMIIAGYHTTGAAITWLCHHLCREQGAVERMRAEYESVSDLSGELCPNRLSAATSSLAFVKEVLRLYPSAWWTTRELKQDCIVEGQYLSKGTTLIFSPWLYHRDPANFDQPDSFSTDRSYAGTCYLPFGAGPRACVGMGVALLELQLIALEFASTLDLESVKPWQIYHPVPGVTLGAPPIAIGVRVRGLEKSALTRAA